MLELDACVLGEMTMANDYFDPNYEKAEGDYKVRVNLTALSTTELAWLSSGIDSALESRRRGADCQRRWTVPATALEVFVGKRQRG